MPGLFVTFEGPEGAGKSTQITLLAGTLRTRGYSVVETREPGGTEIGEQIRGLLLDRGAAGMTAETEAYLHTAARAQHVRQIIEPALERGNVVLCDRFLESTLAYQGGGRGLSLDDLWDLQKLATGPILPGVRLLLDLPVELGLQRRRGDAASTNRMDDEAVAFHERVRQAYHVLLNQNPSGWRLIDARNPVDVVQSYVQAAVVPLLTGVVASTADARATGRPVD